MPKKFIHPVMRTVTVVFRNGSSIQVPSTVANKGQPYLLQTVRTAVPAMSCACSIHQQPLMTCGMAAQDTTNHPAWTGKQEVSTGDEGQMAKFIKRFGGLGDQEPGTPKQ